MALTVVDAATTIRCAFRASGPTLGNYTYNTRRGFLRFDTDGYNGIVDAELIVVCTSIVGGGDTVLLKSATGAAGWGVALDATEADFTSTITHLEDSQDVFSTGTYTFDVDPLHIDCHGITYFRLQVNQEGAAAPYSKAAVFASQDHGTAGSRPILRLTLGGGQVILVNAL